ncbi:DUF4367 domain-containing protein [Marinicrinis sediminis]|uniref:DUF4367 domain-containing protein n=1 Tax=Marinicrinis sediminis TaxID=1652465 RepID=A0ABW5R7F2_9BACL
MRKITVLLALVICASVFMAGCGSKSANDVVGDLQGISEDLNSYYGAGVMTLNMGENPQRYGVEVSYQEPHYYRIALTNMEKDITQIVLRNDEGVYVLTPHLKKSFRFQSDWPSNQGQVYLFQTLAASILEDEQRQFVLDKENKSYVFDVNANYQNHALVRQKIWLDQKSYAPKRVEVADANNQVLVEVQFDQFEFNKSFEADSFDMQRNMTSYHLQSIPTMATEGEGDAGEAPASFGVRMPAYTPAGVVHDGVHDIEFGNGTAVMLQYSGDYQYTIVESHPTDHPVSSEQGEIIDLGYTIGILSGDSYKMLTWYDEGVEFRLSSGNLPKEEMMKIAQSVQGQMGK